MNNLMTEQAVPNIQLKIAKLAAPQTYLREYGTK